MTPTAPIVVAALYKFVTLSDYVQLREPLLKAMVDNGIKGTLLIAEEGINGTVSGSREGIDGLMAWRARVTTCWPALTTWPASAFQAVTMPAWSVRSSA